MAQSTSLEDAVRALKSLTTGRARTSTSSAGLRSTLRWIRRHQHRLRDEYPHRSGEDEIPWGEAQWVRGDHMALRYRGNVLTRTKMWFQESDPMENVKGFLKYFYTGWQYKVMPATAGVEKVPWLAEFTNRVTVVGFGQRDHHIVTMYEKEDCGIGMHSDKPKSIDPNSVILVVKTGDCGRPFRITDNRGGADQDKELFCDVVAPGDAVLMSMKANLRDQAWRANRDAADGHERQHRDAHDRRVGVARAAAKGAREARS